ncbi:serine threonine-protein kinase nek10 [Limosa lapponica baueri]|uniref:Serine threonine-protein kinase nek10 n=1 Tax=Limosa lapponica baueri TaxID=1758121 RepID=A0A2I0UK77_LIMLA|nr:serine threonine-protein kinase nek10 [Limosa lapponica baueri]
MSPQSWLPAIRSDSSQTSVTKARQNIKSNEQKLHGQWQEPTEVAELENFSEWVNQAPSIHFLRVLICLRLLIRDPCYQEMLHSLGGIENLAQYMETIANGYLNYGEEQHTVDKLVNMTYLFQKLAAVKDQREWVIASGAHKTLVNLLSARDSNVLLGALLALTSLAESPECREKISELTIVENLLVILREYDLLSKRLTAELLRLLCAESQIKEQVKMYEGVPVLLSLLHSDHIKLLRSIVWILVQVCEDPETSAEIRIWGGIKQLLHILQGLFPTDLFEIFIDIGHYVRDISAYEELVSKLNLLKEDELKQIAESIENMNQNKAPTKHIGNYAILEHLGSGAFGSVYKVRKHNGQNLLALKEVNLHNPAFGKDKKDRDSSVKNIVSELTIIKEQLCLALRYLHKEKRIVHRDLTPNNVMLGDKDKVTITDFGLAKQKQENSKLASVVGTILYSCPEVVKSEPYGEKADVWAAGCILYQMATLNPPFYSTNMLSLASKIVGAVYEPVPEGLYSEKVSFTIQRCLTPDAEARPDIVEVSSLLSDVMMKYLDVLSTSHLMLEKKLDRERRRTQRHFMEANRNAVTYHHQLSILSQKNYEKVSLHSNSSRTASYKRDFSENADLPAESCQSACGKDEKRTYEENLVEDHSTLENSEKDDELDVLDNLSSSSSSHLKESTIVIEIILKVWDQDCDQLLQGSPELIDPNFFTADWHVVLLSSGGNMLLPDDRKGIVGNSDIAEGMTYEQLQDDLLFCCAGIP